MLTCSGEIRSSRDSNDPADFDVVVNASPLGLQPGDPLPCDVSRMAPHAALVDFLMKNQPRRPWCTPRVHAVWWHTWAVK